MADNWLLYKRRIDKAYKLVDRIRNDVITKRANYGLDVAQAIRDTDEEIKTILKQVGAVDMYGYRIVTKKNWVNAGYPIVKDIEQNALYKYLLTKL